MSFQEELNQFSHSLQKNKLLSLAGFLLQSIGSDRLPVYTMRLDLVKPIAELSDSDQVLK